MRKILAIVVLGCLVGSAWGDQIDEAEAKRRGVSVETIQLENAKTRIAALEKENAELKAKLAATRPSPATTKSAITSTTPARPAYDTYKDVKIGMKKADLPPGYSTVENKGNIEVMEFQSYIGGSGRNFTFARVTLSNGVVTRFETFNP